MRRSREEKPYRRPKPLVLEMGRVLEKLVDSHRNDPEVLRLAPRADFLLDYIFVVLRYRESLLNPELERDEELEEEISKKERLGVSVGFTEQRLIAAARAVAQRTPTQEEIETWKEKVLRAKMKVGER